MHRASRPCVTAGLAILAILTAPCVIVVPSGVMAAPRSTAHSYSYSFADADIPSVANEILGVALKLPFTVDPAVTGKMTMRVQRRLTSEQLLEVFESALAANGVAMLRTGGQVLLLPRAKAKESGARTRLRGGGMRPGYQIVAEPLDYATPSEIAKLLSASGPPDIVVQADDKLGLLVLGGSSAEITAAETTISLFDRSGLADARMRMVPLTSASPAAVAADLERLMQAAGISGAKVVPARQLNAVIVLAKSRAAVDQLSAWVTRFDRPSLEEASTLWVYRARNVQAESLADALRSLSQQGGGSSRASPAPSGEAATSEQTPAPGGSNALDPDQLRVSVEKASNSLLVMAPASRWNSIRRALEQIDRAPDQVLIEATILEVTLNNDFRLGVDWTLLSGNGKLGATLSNTTSGVVAPTYPGVSLTYLNGGVRAVVDALSAKTNVQVMSAPKLVALDNQSASLQVGDQVPVVVQRAQSTNAPGAPLVVTTEYRDTGVILRIKPRINGDHTVLLDLSQEVSGVAKTTSSGIDSPTIQQRKFQSSLEVRDDQTVALGGLISTTNSIDEGGVPLLSSIPLAGHLFKTSNKTKRRTELIVLLSARILRSAQADHQEVDELKASMIEIERSGLFERH